MNESLSVIILAAGKGTRMKSNKAKVLHEVYYQPMVQHVVNSVEELNTNQTIVVVGHQKEAVQNSLQGSSVTFTEQKVQLGTGHAVLAAEDALKEAGGTVMILCGDTPLIKPTMLQDLFRQHLASSSTVTLVTTILDDPTNYGRIISDNSGNIQAIVEHKDANEEELKVCEINAGIYCVDKEFLFSTLQNVGTDNSQGEVYLTDIVKMAVDSNRIVKTFVTKDSIDVLGVNSRLDLAQAQKELQLRRNRDLMGAGVSMINPETIRISPDSEVEPDCVLEPGVHITDGSQLANSVIIEQGAIIKNCTIGPGAKIGAYCYLENISIKEGETVTPYSSPKQ